MQNMQAIHAFRLLCDGTVPICHTGGLC